jgi:hypothetical protein
MLTLNLFAIRAAFVFFVGMSAALVYELLRLAR